MARLIGSVALAGVIATLEGNTSDTKVACRGGLTKVVSGRDSSAEPAPSNRGSGSQNSGYVSQHRPGWSRGGNQSDGRVHRAEPAATRVRPWRIRSSLRYLSVRAGLRVTGYWLNR